MELFHILYVSVAVAGSLYFCLAKRPFDLLSVAYFSCMFYFMPMLFGYVPQARNHGIRLDLPVIYLRPEVFLFATLVTGSLLAAAVARDRWRQDATPAGPTALPCPVAPGFAHFYLAIALVALGATIAIQGSDLLTLNKTELLHRLGHSFVIFEFAASLACITAVMERKYGVFAAAVLLLALDLGIGFRYMSVLTLLSCIYYGLSRRGAIRILRDGLPFIIAVGIALVAFLLVGPIRYAIAGQPLDLSLRLVLHQFLASEPFITQTILNTFVATSFSCPAQDLFRNLLLLFIPSSSIFSIPPPNFTMEFQPVLFPGITFGMAGNIWAEMLCRFGYPGVILFSGIFAAGLAVFSRLIRQVVPAARPPLILCAMFAAFYIQRNDLFLTLLLMRRVLIIAAIAWALHQAARLCTDAIEKRMQSRAR